MLVCAIGKMHVDSVRASVERAAAAVTPQELTSALLTAVMIGHSAAAAELLDRGADVNAADSSSRTPLLEATFGGHLDAVDLLLTRGAEVNAKDKDGWTALMEAASKCRTEIVRLLLARGADPKAVSNAGWTALKVAARGNHELMTLLRKTPDHRR